MGTLKKLGVRVAAISVEPVADLRDSAKRKGFTYPILSDARLKVSDAYNVTATGEGFAKPALFLIDRKGQVRLGRVGVAHGPFDAQALESAIALLQKTQG